MRLEHMSCA